MRPSVRHIESGEGPRAGNFGVADEAHGRERGHGGHRRFVGPALVDDHVARQQQADLKLGVECPVGKPWIAGTENHVRAKVAVQLLLVGRSTRKP